VPETNYVFGFYNANLAPTISILHIFYTAFSVASMLLVLQRCRQYEAEYRTSSFDQKTANSNIHIATPQTFLRLYSAGFNDTIVRGCKGGIRYLAWLLLGVLMKSLTHWYRTS